MLDELDDEDAKKLKYIAVFGVAVIIMLVILLYALDMMGGGVKKRNKTKRAEIPTARYEFCRDATESEFHS